MLYAYTAINNAGLTSAGEREADSERSLAEKLKTEGLFLIEAKEAQTRIKELFTITSLTLRLRPITLVDRMMFARNLAVMIGAGLPLSKALNALEEQVEGAKFKTLIADLRESVLKGVSFAEALRKHEEIFGSLFVNMVESGEISGKLEYVLKLLTRQMKRDHDLISKVQGALIYPAVIIFALILIGALMMIYVVPVLTSTFRELAIPLPLTTRMVINTSEFLVNYYFLILGLIPVAGYSGWRFLKTDRGKFYWSTASLRLPILGTLVKRMNSARFSRILASLIASGLPISRALEITSKVLGNIHFKNSLSRASSEIQKGRALSDILKERPELYPPLVTQMLAVGEETGTSTRMLLRLALFYESEVSNATKNISSIIEPVLMIFIGAVVGFFAISMIQPIYSGISGI